MEIVFQLANLLKFGQIFCIVIIGLCCLAIIASFVIKATTYNSSGWLADIGIHGLVDFTGLYTFFLCMELICKNLEII